MTERAGPVRHERSCVWLLVFFFAASAPAWAASPFADAAAELDGQWQGDDFVLKIDSTRAQASLNPARPLDWHRFLVTSVSGRTVTFTVGAELFEAIVAGDALSLTGTSFRGERVLRRLEARPAETRPRSRIEPGLRGSAD